MKKFEFLFIPSKTVEVLTLAEKDISAMIVIAAFLLVNCRTLQHIVLVLHTYPAND